MKGVVNLFYVTPIFVFRWEMAGNPRAKAVRRNITFIQESMVAVGVTTVANHLYRLDLISGEDSRHILPPFGKEPAVDQAATLMKTVESRIRNFPDVYFKNFIEALRRSNLEYVTKRLFQTLDRLQDDPRSSTCESLYCTTADYASLRLRRWHTVVGCVSVCPYLGFLEGHEKPSAGKWGYHVG